MSRRRARDDLEFPIAVAAYVPLIILRLGIGYLRIKAQRRRGVRTFRRTLIKSGMPPEIAKRFASDFEAFGSLRRYLPEIPFLS